MSDNPFDGLIPGINDSLSSSTRNQTILSDKQKQKSDITEVSGEQIKSYQEAEGSERINNESCYDRNSNSLTGRTMCENISDNPFVGLFPTINDALSFSPQSQVILNDKKKLENTEVPREQVKKDTRDTNNSNYKESEEDQVNRILADVFGITLHRSNNRKRLVYVSGDSIELAVFNRLVLTDPKSKLTTVESKNYKDNAYEPHIVETEIIPFLFESFLRLQKSSVKGNSSIIDTVRYVIFSNTATALQVPVFFEDQQIHEQFVKLFEDGTILTHTLSSFVNGIVDIFQAGDEDNSVDIETAFAPVLDIIQKQAAQSDLIFKSSWFTILHIFATIEPLAKLVICHSTPKSEEGYAYADTLLGALFNLSCLPKTNEDQFGYFSRPLNMSKTTLENNIWTVLDSLSEALHKVFHLLLKRSGRIRNLTLRWIADCLRTNANRGKLWNAHNDLGFGAMLCVPDGFMLNLGNVLLRLCQPFCVKSNESKIPSIDPTYCAAEVRDENEGEERGIHLRGLSSETCLLPLREGNNRPVAKSFNFVTECFFLTHRALDLGYRVVLDKFLRTSQDLARIQMVYDIARNRSSTEALEAITERLAVEMTKYLGLRVSLLVPKMLKLLAWFHATTATWLVQVYLNDVNTKEEQNDYVPKEYKPVNFPLPDTVPDTLRCIPEFVVENTITFLCVLRRSSRHTFEEEGSDFMMPILTEIIVLMESQKRLYNPHLRAGLANALEALLPTTDNTTMPLEQNLVTFNREQLFTTHPHRKHIVGNLLEVFISIEMTGQSVQFEQKFNYRRPMYLVMEYLWQIPEHRNIFISLAEQAEANMEAAQPPLFLRFINLLMNDAVFLLDEALSNMAQLRQMIQARENGEWDKLPEHERVQQAAYLEHIGRNARSDNILGKKTIETLQMLTAEIKSIFCHPTMVDRIASMLNYLLLQLVGPNKKNLKVNDQEEYAFDPAGLVLSICEIYINLSTSKSFTLAVSQDGRSYSPELFMLAENVLVRIGGVGILGDLSEFAKSVEAAANQKKEEDEILIDAPEEFLDPIMSTIMADPVILPSSRITIDRQTIARHLLSDQTDPFNRSPLTMEMVKPDIELQAKIQQWIQRKKQEYAISNHQR